MGTDLNFELEARQKREMYRVKGIVVGRSMELEEHRVATADDVWHRVSSAESDQNFVRRGAAVVNGQIILHDVALIPDSAEESVSYSDLRNRPRANI